MLVLWCLLRMACLAEAVVPGHRQVVTFMPRLPVCGSSPLHLNIPPIRTAERDPMLRKLDTKTGHASLPIWVNGEGATANRKVSPLSFQRKKGLVQSRAWAYL